MAAEYGLPPVNEQPLDYVGWSTAVKPGGIWSRAPTTADTNYPIGYEAIYQVSASATDVYVRVPDSTAWQLLEGAGAGGVLAVADGGTGDATLTAHAVLVGNGTSPVSQVGPGAVGTSLQGLGSGADPVFLPTATGSGVGFSNAGFTYSSSTFRVTSRNGTALSATNPLPVTFQSNATPGINKTINVTANQGFIDSTGASQITGNLFGTTTGVAWASDMPFFVYAVANSAAGSPETAIAFMISRNPAAVTTSGATIANLGANTADAEVDFYSLANITIGDYANSPAVWIGSFRMQKTAGDDWTVQALSRQDGPGVYDETTNWTFPTNQNGAAVGTYFTGGTINPVFGTAAYVYWLYRNGQVRFLFNGLTTVTSGTGATDLRFVIPINSNEGNISATPGWLRFAQNSVITLSMLGRNNDTNANYFTIVPATVSGATATATVGVIMKSENMASGAGADAITNIAANGVYQAF